MTNSSSFFRSILSKTLLEGMLGILIFFGIWGGKDVPSQLPFHASSLYSRNVVNLLMLMTKSETTDGATRATVTPDFADEIIAAAALTHDGAIRERK